MIFYFSGTGNSLHVAKAVAAAQNQEIASVPAEFEKAKGGKEYVFAEGDMLGFVFPIYAWAPPRMVLDFIGAMRIKGAEPYTFSVSTCGGNEGDATRLVRKALSRKGLELDSAFTVKMPSNYVVGMDVKKPEEISEILRAAEGDIGRVNAALARRADREYLLVRGEKPFLKTALVAPMFNAFARSTRSFFATDACTGCGLCERICPARSIVVAGKPSWGKACTQCLACINRCPAQAIQYGKGTINRRRYVHPDLK